MLVPRRVKHRKQHHPKRSGAAKGGTTIDMSASWKINDQFELTLEGLNLTDAYQDQWVDAAADRVSVYHHTGRQFFVGLRFKL